MADPVVPLNRLWQLLRCLLLSWLCLAGAAQAAELGTGATRVELWPSLSMLAETGPRLSAQQALAAAQAGQFGRPDGAKGALGLRQGAVWLRIPLQVASQDDGEWVLELDYPPLNHIEVYLLYQGQILQQAALGNLLPRATRPLASRNHALPLSLPPGRGSELLLRVQTQGAMTVPITLAKPAAYQSHALSEQLLQGLLNGLGLALLVYSLAQWLSLREPLFAKYALLITGSLLFSLLQFGTGAQFLWPDSIWMEQHAGGLSALIAACGSYLFIEQALQGSSLLFRRLMWGGAALTQLSALVFAFDLIDVRVITVIISTLGLAPAVMGLPGALRRARQRDAIGWCLLLAWLVYLLTTAVAIGVIKGRLDANFWTLHAFQFGASFDMLMFMRVLGLRTAAIKQAAAEARHERDLLHALAHTDALTGLANRRGLQLRMDELLARRRPEHQLALFLLDLNGFKQVNDRHGHETGDALLVAVARRLQAKLHPGDLVARLGGDEFVVVCAELSQPRQAEALGERLLEAFSSPFQIGTLSCELGMALGQALAPQDGGGLPELLAHADAAMYRGKRAQSAAAFFAP